MSEQVNLYLDAIHLLNNGLTKDTDSDGLLECVSASKRVIRIARTMYKRAPIKGKKTFRGLCNWLNTDAAVKAIIRKVAETGKVPLPNGKVKIVQGAAVTQDNRERLYKLLGGHLTDCEAFARILRSIWRLSMFTFCMAVELAEQEDEKQKEARVRTHWMLPVLICETTKYGKLRKAETSSAILRYSRNHNTMYLIDTGKTTQIVFWAIADRGCYQECTRGGSKSHFETRTHFDGLPEDCDMVLKTLASAYYDPGALDRFYDGATG